MLFRDAEILLAVHSSFWGKRHKRWGLPGGNIEWREDPIDTVRRELREELQVNIREFTEIGVYQYKGNNHIVFGAHTDHAIEDYDTRELLDIGWYSMPSVESLKQERKLHAGYELHAAQTYLSLLKPG